MKPEETEVLIKYRLEQALTALLQEIGKIPSKHAGVISLFDTEFAKKELFPKELSRDFHRAFELRQVSDYRTTKPLQRNEAEQVRNKAVGFFQAVKDYLQK